MLQKYKILEATMVLKCCDNGVYRVYRSKCYCKIFMKIYNDNFTNSFPTIIFIFMLF